MTKLTDSDQRVMRGYNYVHTTSPKFKKNGVTDYNGQVHGLCETSLISLIYGLQQKEFGLNTVWKVIQDINRYNAMHCDTGARYLDSGGYSLIIGDCLYRDIFKFINCYTHAIKSYENLDRILSLDIPFFINEPKRCNVSTIYALNKESLEKTIGVVKEIPELKNKLMFIQQFKMRRQYQIFSKLYKDLEIWKYMDQSATGGLVGLGAATSINFAPFIGPVFLAFSRFLNHRPDNGFFNHHVLGQYHLHARFTIQFLEKLFGSLDGIGHCKVSYDSINFFLSSTMKLRAEHKYCRIPTTNPQDIIHFKNLIELDRSELTNVYPKEVIPDAINELDIIKGGNGNVKDVSFAVPLYAYSQLQIDDLFLKLVDEYGMINIFKNANSARTLKNQFNSIINSIHVKYSFLLGAQFTRKLMINIQLCYAFYSGWYINNRTDEKMDELMTAFIKKIDFPCDLDDK